MGFVGKLPKPLPSCLPIGTLTHHSFSQSCRGPRTPIQPRKHVISAALPADMDDTDSAWSRLSLLKRQLAIAVREEDFSTASRLKDEAARVEANLSSQKQILIGLLEKLQNGETPRERITAAQSLGDLGDTAGLPALQAVLGVESLGDVAESSMWSVFMRTPNEEVEKLMSEGLVMMQRPSTFNQALEIFDRMIKAAPTFAEGYNKRATTYYLMQRYQESVDDCKLVLDLNPYHFGAASGMGMCCAALKDYKGAIAAFETAVAINPRLEHLKHHILQLKEIIEEEQGRN